MKRMPYADRRDAGRVLAGLLQDYAGAPGLLVLALPRGGVPVAGEVARVLGGDLDILVVRKIGVPDQPEVAMGAMAAVADAIETVQNDDVMRQLRMLGWDAAGFGEVAAREEIEMRRRQQAYRAGRPAPHLEGRTVILVDDGLATGATMRAAVLAVRRHHPLRIIVAVPVALGDTESEMRQLADDVVCAWSATRLHAVGQAYEVFDQTTDDEVRAILDVAWTER
ncbi:phosphoribosyltransferase [Cryobacterium tepidiphilum]|uniref:Phosphoribosyltransferase n=1 Tax=Cryobacterium tepidiphilum TaxID=2486026 RepID=A0A3M8LEP3_9MICO|nr:phosphoribosyltransferase family protein [Cryobacterium tepidiphilum]RNE63931.1 phosphoribosyltransferase [Cryobacterium tepidiphilum]